MNESAPFSNAERRVSSSVRLVKTRTLVSGHSLLIRRVASSSNARHHHVHHHEIWLHLANKDDRRLAIVCLPDQKHSRVLAEDEANQGADLDIVIGDDDSNGSARVSRS